jgi:hypothetical protein
MINKWIVAFFAYVTEFLPVHRLTLLTNRILWPIASEVYLLNIMLIDLLQNTPVTTTRNPIGRPRLVRPSPQPSTSSYVASEPPLRRARRSEPAALPVGVGIYKLLIFLIWEVYIKYI